MKPKRKKKPLNVAIEVLDAIKRGKRTFTEIQRETGRTANRVSDALAFLLLKAGRIRIESSSNGRVYVPATPRHRKPEPQRGTLTETAPLSFSTLADLMPRATARVSETRK
jgi:hypothetical protein